MAKLSLLMTIIRQYQYAVCSQISENKLKAKLKKKKYVGFRGSLS